VIPDRIVCFDAEWRTFASDDGPNNKVRTETSNALLGNAQTFIDNNNGRGSGRQSAQNKKDKQITKAMTTINNLGDDLSDDIKQRAAEVFKQTLDKSIKGQNFEVLVATCILIACRKEKVGRSLEEVCGMTGVPKPSLSKCFTTVTRELDITLDVINTANLVPRVCDYVGIKEIKHVQKCIEIGEKLNLQQQGRNPKSITAASVYLVAKEYYPEIRLSEICKFASISEQTVLQVVKANTLDLPGIFRK